MKFLGVKGINIYIFSKFSGSFHFHWGVQNNGSPWNWFFYLTPNFCALDFHYFFYYSFLYLFTLGFFHFLSPIYLPTYLSKSNKLDNIPVSNTSGYASFVPELDPFLIMKSTCTKNCSSNINIYIKIGTCSVWYPPTHHHHPSLIHAGPTCRPHLFF